MRKARSGKEVVTDTLTSDSSNSDESRPRRRRGKTVEKEQAERVVRRRIHKEEPAAARPAVESVRPILTAIPRPAREEAPSAQIAPPEPAREADASIAAIPRIREPMQVIKLNDLKRMKITELSKMAHDSNIEGAQGLKKQELIFALLSGIADKRFEVHAEGVLELLSDGFGFLRSADSDYQPSPDDIYVSPSQVRRFNLRPGDTVTGPIRQPREGERFFALQKVDKVNFVDPFGPRASLTCSPRLDWASDA
jgi:transcription termination factor Rho